MRRLVDSVGRPFWLYVRVDILQGPVRNFGSGLGCGRAFRTRERGARRLGLSPRNCVTGWRDWVVGWCGRGAGEGLERESKNCVRVVQWFREGGGGNVFG